MSIRFVLGNWIARHNQLLWFRSNGQPPERSQVAQPFAVFAKAGDNYAGSLRRAACFPSVSLEHPRPSHRTRKAGPPAGNTWKDDNTFIAGWMDSSNGVDMQEMVGGVRLK
jgi:hypothetical protein